MTGNTGEDRAGDPQDMLATLQSQSLEARRQLDVDSRLLYLVWGAAWVVGFLALYLSTPYGRTPTISAAVGGLSFAALMLLAGAVTAVHTSRRVRGIRGASSTQGTMYGLAWGFGFSAMFVIGIGLSRAGATDELMATYFAAAPGLVVGLMYLFGGTLWQDRLMYLLGVWIVAVFSAASVVGPPHSYLIMAGLAGGGFVAAGLLVQRAQAAGLNP